jgi:hypothetical protein
VTAPAETPAAVPELRGTVLRTVLSALEDAADYRRDQGDCGACKPDAKCRDHAIDDYVAADYDLLFEELQGAGARS